MIQQYLMERIYIGNYLLTFLFTDNLTTLLVALQVGLLSRHLSERTENVSMAQHPLVGQRLLINEVSRLHSDTPHSVGLLWTSAQPDAETST
jgi:hypothetical protein